jgi:hypothetical protein
MNLLERYHSLLMNYRDWQRRRHYDLRLKHKKLEEYHGRKYQVHWEWLSVDRGDE